MRDERTTDADPKSSEETSAPGTAAQEADPEIGPGTRPDDDSAPGDTPATPGGRP